MLKVLLVEDDLSFRQLLSDFVQSQFPAVAVAEAKTSDETLTQLQTSHPDLVIINVNLFEGGLALARRVKRLYPQIAVVMTANHDIPECRQAVLRAGANCLLIKSGSFINEVLALIEGLLSFRDATAAARAIASVDNRLAA
jgi:DNA-binding NarL/FixJ family response regulator